MNNQEVSPKHPRAESLRIRAALTRGFEMGVTSAFGLFAHGRGEAFDYLLGEQTTENAKKAIRVAAAAFLLAQHPVISVNGNVVALVPHELIHLSQVTKAKLEINLYHRSRTREKAIAKMLKEAGAKEILGINPKTQKIIQEVHSDRRVVDKRGLLIADMAFIPLEDGDRTEGLVRLDKKVITIDLNPLSRTAQLATITIVDNVVRALPLLVNYVKELRNENKEALQKIVNTFNNRANLSEAINLIKERLKNLAESNGIRCNGGTRQLPSIK